MIEVMKAYTEGKPIEYRSIKNNHWRNTALPCWDWDNFVYRVKSEKKEKSYPYVIGEFYKCHASLKNPGNSLYIPSSIDGVFIFDGKDFIVPNATTLSKNGIVKYGKDTVKYCPEIFDTIIPAENNISDCSSDRPVKQTEELENALSSVLDEKRNLEEKVKKLEEENEKLKTDAEELKNGLSYLVHKEMCSEQNKLKAEIEELKDENLKLKEEVKFLHEEQDIPSELMNLPYQEYESLQRTIGELNNVKKSLIRTNLIHLSVIKSNGLTKE